MTALLIIPSNQKYWSHKHVDDADLRGHTVHFLPECLSPGKPFSWTWQTWFVRRSSNFIVTSNYKLGACLIAMPIFFNTGGKLEPDLIFLSDKESNIFHELIHCYCEARGLIFRCDFDHFVSNQLIHDTRPLRVFKACWLLLIQDLMTQSAHVYAWFFWLMWSR